MKDMRSLGASFSKVVSAFLGVAMIFLTAITFLQVIARYFLKISIGGLEELPVYLMVASVWLAGALLSQENGHITLDILDLIVKNKRLLAGVNAVLNMVTIVGLAIFAWLMGDYTIGVLQAGTISPGLKFPMWWMSGLTVLCVVLMALFEIANTVTTLKEMRHGDTH